MHEIPAVVRRPLILVYHCGGGVDVYETIDDFFRSRLFWLQWPEYIQGHIGEQYGNRIDEDGFNVGPWTKVRTEDGEVLGPAELVRLFWIHYARRKAKVRTWENRYARRRRRLRRRLRHPKTQNEKRQAFAEDDEPPIRAKRNLANLVDAWDDIISKPQKSWKWQSKRRRQYRERRATAGNDRG